MERIDNEEQKVGRKQSIAAGDFISAVARLAREHSIEPHDSIQLMGVMGRMLASHAVENKGVEMAEAVGSIVEAFMLGLGLRAVEVDGEGNLIDRGQVLQ